MNIKIYKVGEVDWVAASSPEEAIKYLETMSGNQEDSALELTEDQLKRYRYMDPDLQEDEERSFMDELQKRISDKEKFPQHFATSEW